MSLYKLKGYAPGHRHKFLDVRVWALCFASYISVMANRGASRIPDLLGDLVHKIKASLKFKEPSWENYDNIFRRQAAVMSNQNWSSLNLSLFQCASLEREKTYQMIKEGNKWHHGKAQGSFLPKSLPRRAQSDNKETVTGSNQAIKDSNTL